MKKQSHKKAADSMFDISHNAPACGIIRCFISRVIMWMVGWKVTGKFPKDKKFILVANKTDMLVEAPEGFKSMVEMECVFVSAKRK